MKYIFIAFFSFFSFSAFSQLDNSSKYVNQGITEGAVQQLQEMFADLWNSDVKCSKVDTNKKQKSVMINYIGGLAPAFEIPANTTLIECKEIKENKDDNNSVPKTVFIVPGLGPTSN